MAAKVPRYLLPVITMIPRAIPGSREPIIFCLLKYEVKRYKYIYKYNLDELALERAGCLLLEDDLR
jgi:hypothetical protein